MPLTRLMWACSNQDSLALVDAAPDAFAALPPRTSLLLAGVASGRGAFADAAMTVLADLVAGAPALSLRAIDQAFRSARSLAQHRVDVSALSARLKGGTSTRLKGGTDNRLAVGLEILSSFSRNGYERQDGLYALARRHSPVVIAPLLIRTADPVRDLAEEAAMAILRFVDDAKTSDNAALGFARALPLVLQMSMWHRTRLGDLHLRIIEMLRTSSPGKRALSLVARGDDVTLRRAALRVQLEGGRASIAETIEVIGATLLDDNPRIRLAAANLALKNNDVARVFLARLFEDRSPHIRALTLRAHARLAEEAGDDATIRDVLVGATFDANANVRFWARKLILKFGGAFDYRGQALAILSTSREHTRDKEVVAALANLSEFGRAEDIDVVERFEHYPRRGVSREARRTLGILRRL